MPVDTAAPSVNANFGWWQVAQATLPSADSRLSKYSSLPKSDFAREYRLSAGHWIGNKPSGARISSVLGAGFAALFAGLAAGACAEAASAFIRKMAGATAASHV